MVRFDVTRSSAVTDTAFLITVLVEALFWDLSVSGWAIVGSGALLGGIVPATKRARRAAETLAGHPAGAVASPRNGGANGSLRKELARET